jgi:hypothetical protein
LCAADFTRMRVIENKNMHADLTRVDREKKQQTKI